MNEKIKEAVNNRESVDSTFTVGEGEKKYANMSKPIICIDFDGVVHDYYKGWQDGSIYGDVVPGFFDWAVRANKDFNLIIYSSRSKDKDMRLKMENWIWLHYMEWCGNNDKITDGRAFDALFEFSTGKPAAYITIDDRAICFQGDWNAPEFSPEAILAFKPWNSHE